MGPLHNKQALLFIHFIVCQATIWYTPDFHQWKDSFPLVEIFFSLMSAPLRHPTT